MKTIILAGGLGTRIAEYTNKIPKPMIKIGGIPLLTHIMRIFTSYGFNEFIIAAGYKKKIIQKYYLNSKEFKNLQIIDTGKNTMTGGRLLRLKKYFDKGENFFMTYGDGLSDLNLKSLKNFHLKHQTLVKVEYRVGLLTQQVMVVNILEIVVALVYQLEMLLEAKLDQ